MSEQRPERPNRKAPRPGAPGANGGLKFGRGVFGWLLFIGLAVMLFMLLSQNNQNYRDVKLSDFQNQLERGKVQDMVIDGPEVTGTFTEDFQGGSGAPFKKFKTTVSSGTSPDWFYQYVSQHRGTTAFEIKDSNSLLVNILLPLIPWLLIFGFIWFFVFRQLRNSAGAGGMLGNFGRSKHKITSK